MMTSGPLPVYQVRARNTAVESENKMHDDTVAAQFGFRGGLVPGVVVYAYMTVPIVARFGSAWLERGAMQVKFHQPFYDGDLVTVRAEVDADAEPIKVAVRAEREDGTACATALATVGDDTAWLGEPRREAYPESPLPEFATRPAATRDAIIAGATLGTIEETIDAGKATLLEQMGERLPIYAGADAVAHPFTLLSLANHILMQNFKLGPWIHVASDLINLSAARAGDRVTVRGRIADRFERKGHEFIVMDLLTVANGSRVVQQVRHTAIYRPRGI
jgi:acyl dehydratase